MDHSPYQEKLDWLVCDPQRAFQYMHRVMFLVDGYDLDPRGLSVIPEVKQYFEVLHKRWPYYLYFSVPIVEAFSWWMGCIYFPVVGREDGNANFMEVTPALYRVAMEDFFSHANGLAEKYDFPMDDYFNRQKEMVDAINEWCVSGIRDAEH